MTPPDVVLRWHDGKWCNHERWCPLCDGYSGPLETDDCHCDDHEQQDIYYDAMERFR